MKATDLIGCAVFDSDGAELGHVHDLRLESEGRPEDGNWRCRLTGLVCGGSIAIGHRLGYGTGDMAGPWPLTTLFGRRQQRRLTVPWREVDQLQPGRITLHASRRQIEQAQAEEAQR
jgi:PRC-barrel domain